MIIILLGAPGSGKGTQAKLVAERYGLTHLSTGDIFRAEMAAKTSVGLKAEGYVKSGQLVPDSIVTEMVAGRMDPAKKYLLDGFPRNLEQAHCFAGDLGHLKMTVNLVVYLNLPEAEVVKRLSSRRSCGKCGEVYNLLSSPPKASGVCDKCGGAVIQREDDTENTVRKRLLVFRDLTEPLVAYYKAEGLIKEVDAAGGIDGVTKSVCGVIDGLLAETKKK
ncbi:MAG: adenylate kinase [Elusimicrobia bacterium]|nr:adenylate kinase [Elusimicrobiota bacterium]